MAAPRARGGSGPPRAAPAGLRCQALPAPARPGRPPASLAAHRRGGAWHVPTYHTQPLGAAAAPGEPAPAPAVRGAPPLLATVFHSLFHCCVLHPTPEPTRPLRSRVIKKSRARAAPFGGRAAAGAALQVRGGHGNACAAAITECKGAGCGGGVPGAAQRARGGFWHCGGSYSQSFVQSLGAPRRGRAAPRGAARCAPRTGGRKRRRGGRRPGGGAAPFACRIGPGGGGARGPRRAGAAVGRGTGERRGSKIDGWGGHNQTTHPRALRLRSKPRARPPSGPAPSARARPPPGLKASKAFECLRAPRRGARGRVSPSRPARGAPGEGEGCGEGSSATARARAKPRARRGLRPAARGGRARARLRAAPPPLVSCCCYQEAPGATALYRAFAAFCGTVLACGACVPGLGSRPGLGRPGAGGRKGPRRPAALQLVFCGG